MPRDPSIHVTQTQLENILNTLLSDNNNKENKELATKILRLASKQSPLHRKLQITTKKIERDFKVLSLSPDDNTATFHNILYMIRTGKLKHKGVKKIDASSREWSTLKKITANATRFTEDFDLTIQQGYTKYIEIGLRLMNGYQVMRLQGLHEKIVQEYEGMEKIRQDKNSQLTEQVHKIYGDLIYSKTGINSDYSKDPSQYQFFIEVSLFLKKNPIKPIDYIKAQFEGLEWANAIPTPSQLAGDKAVERLNKYMVAHKLTIKKQEKFKPLDWSKIKKT